MTLVVDSIIRDLAKSGTIATFDRFDKTLDVGTHEHRPLRATWSLQADEQLLEAVLDFHQANEHVPRYQAYDYLLTEILRALDAFSRAETPGPYRLDSYGRVVRTY